MPKLWKRGVRVCESMPPLRSTAAGVVDSDNPLGVGAPGSPPRNPRRGLHDGHLRGSRVIPVPRNKQWRMTARWWLATMLGLMLGLLAAELLGC